MPTTYVLKTANSDCSTGADFTKEISTGTEAAGSITISVAKSATETSYGFTASNKPNNNAWQNGNVSAEVNVTTANSNIFLEVTVQQMIDCTTTTGSEFVVGTEQQLSTTGVKTFGPSSVTWDGTQACGRRARVHYKFRNNDSMGAQSVTIETGTVDTEIVMPFTEDVSACAAAAVYRESGAKRFYRRISAGIAMLLPRNSDCGCARRKTIFAFITNELRRYLVTYVS